MSSRRRHRGLSPDERRLWQAVTADVTPIAPRPAPSSAPSSPPAPAVAAPPSAAPGEPAAAAEVAPPARGRTAISRTALRLGATPQPPALAPLPPRERRRIVRGIREIDARIDLHGLTQAEAHVRLRGFLARAQAQGATMVLVITGKGGADGALAADGRGILRRVVPQWLAFAEFRGLVVGFEEAHPAHGGAGALYVRVRKPGRGGTP